MEVLIIMSSLQQREQHIVRFHGGSSEHDTQLLVFKKLSHLVDAR
jgi:hypothetical protein